MDALTPAASQCYLPAGTVKAAQDGSKGVSELTPDINLIMSRLSFEMFSFGEFSCVANLLS